MTFKDHFTKQAESYARFRPDYPDELFEFLASVSPSNEFAWDCATGNGQAANGLAKYFDMVIASDASENQVQNAYKNEKITYKVFPAEKADIESSTVDLITVAQALHWFNFEKFYSEVRRVLKKNGIIAVWMYDLVNISPEIDLITKKFDDVILRNYWPPERQLFYEGYRTIPFPFELVKTPGIKMATDWTLENFTGFLSTWSAFQKYKERENSDPLDLIMNDLQKAWGEEKIRKAKWDLILKVGKV
ncbi:MAG: class I SAM-dependent methyltransferase [Ignavibacteriaceae bacterium]|jgi:ubiquinone/menaquinone biosynthesis C-methylase UbiE